MKLELDELDKNIVRLLQNKKMCGPKISKIANALKLPSSTIHSRIKHLEKEKVITGYNALVDSKKLGKPLTVFALLKLKYPEEPEEIKFDEMVAEKIAVSSPQIQEVHALTGDWELIVKLKVSDTDDYYKLAKECIVPAGRIIKVNGLMSLKTIKEESIVLP